MTKDDAGIVVKTATLAELIAAIDGYRGQLSVFSDQALSELSMMRRFVLALMDEKPPPSVGMNKLPPR